MSTLNGKPILTGTTTTTLTWPTAILPPVYTLFHVAKYNGTNKNRIFTGYDRNWFSGWHNNRTAQAYHLNWITATVNRYPQDNWLLSTDQNAIYRANKVNWTSAAPGSPSYAQLAVNTYNSEPSDWAIAEVMVFDRHLSPSEFMYMEQYLNSKYQLGFPVLQPYLALSAKSLILADGASMSSWTTTNSQIDATATGYGVGGASLPTFNALETCVELHGVSSTVGSYFDFGSTTWHLETNGGFSFVGYVMFTDVMSWERIFDFGNGQNVDNLLLLRNSTSQNIFTGVYTPNTSFDLPGITNNTWQTFACRYIRGVELAIWVDGEKYRTPITTTHGDRTLTKSYIGRSNWSGNAYSALKIREMWWYDHVVSDADIEHRMSQFTKQYHPL